RPPVDNRYISAETVQVQGIRCRSISSSHNNYLRAVLEKIAVAGSAVTHTSAVQRLFSGGLKLLVFGTGHNDKALCPEQPSGCFQLEYISFFFDIRNVFAFKNISILQGLLVHYIHEVLPGYLAVTGIIFYNRRYEHLPPYIRLFDNCGFQAAAS